MARQAKQGEIIKAIHKANGKVTLAALALKIAPKTIYARAKKDPKIQEAIDEARGTFDEELLDFAETKLRSALLKDEQWAIRYVLDKKGKDRGYTERQEITGANGGAIALTWADAVRQAQSEMEDIK